MNPTAFMRPSTDGYDSAFRDAWTIEASTDGDWSEWIPLFSADQLRHAKVEVLREAAAMWSVRGRVAGRMAINYEDVVRTKELRRMADELEQMK